MENLYDVGIANRYALFLEEDDNSLDAIKKKLSKEQRQRNKAIKKENAEAKKTEAVKNVAKQQVTESKPSTEEVPPAAKKEVEETKKQPPRGKEKKPNENRNQRNNNETRDKYKDSRNKENNAPTVEPTDNDWGNPQNDPPPRKNYENKPRERRYDRNDSERPRSYPNQYKKNKDNWAEKEAIDDSTGTEMNQNDENRNVRENGYYNRDHRPRGGSRFRGGRGGRGGSFNNGERRGKYEPRSSEQKEETEANKNDSWGDDNPEEPRSQETIENQDNQKEAENKTTNENDDTTENEQKEEVKEYLTLDEWKKLQGERQKPQYNLRKAGEGEDLTQWKNMRELHKEKEPEFLKNGRTNEKNNELDKENAANENTQRVARQKHIDISVRFKEPSMRGRGGRTVRNNRFGYQGNGNEGRDDRGEGYGNRDRGEGYGNRDRGEGYGNRERRDNRNHKYGDESRPPRKNFGGYGTKIPPKMDDKRAFPSLG